MDVVTGSDVDQRIDSSHGGFSSKPATRTGLFGCVYAQGKLPRAKLAFILHLCPAGAHFCHNSVLEFGVTCAATATRLFDLCVSASLDVPVQYREFEYRTYPCAHTIRCELYLVQLEFTLCFVNSSLGIAYLHTASSLLHNRSARDPNPPGAADMLPHRVDPYSSCVDLPDGQVCSRLS